MKEKQLQKEISRWKKQKTRLLALTGKRKSGKDMFVDYIMKNYPGFKHYRFTDAPDAFARILELPIERRIQQALFKVNKLLFPILGESAYKRRVAILVEREKPKLALIEAVRTKEEYEEFVVRRGAFLIGFTADDRVRHQRALRDVRKKDRKQDEDKMSFAEFMQKERPLIERDIDWIVNKSHVVIENNFSSPKPLLDLIDKLMKELGLKKRTRRS